MKGQDNDDSKKNKVDTKNLESKPEVILNNPSQQKDSHLRASIKSQIHSSSSLSSVRAAMRTKHTNLNNNNNNNMTIIALVGTVIALLIAILLSPTLFSGSSRENNDNSIIDSLPLHAPPPLIQKEAKEQINNEKLRKGNLPNHEIDVDHKSNPSCYTFEEYSLKFIESNNNKNDNLTTYFYRCGTRVIDLDTELNRNKVKFCMKNNPNTLFPKLRIYLENIFEEKLHLQQKDNVAAQQILISRFNDDYCDCLDGTDELQTVACSMSGAVAPLAHKQWKSYLISNANVRLYEDEEIPSQHRTERLLIRLGGPVLPFHCRGDFNIFLSPSRINDGIIDCCDGSDEEEIKEVQQNTENTEHKLQKHEIVNKESLYEKWKRHVETMAPFLDMNSGDTSLIHPNNNNNNNKRSVAAMLLDKDLTSFMTCPRVRKERLREAVVLHNIIERGHTIYLERKLHGWEKYGKNFVNQHGKLQQEIRVTTEEFENRRREIQEIMKKRKVTDPLSAGISESELIKMEKMYKEIRQSHMRLRHMQLILSFRCLGEDFEYYPISETHYNIPLNNVVESSECNSESVQKWMESRRYNNSYIFEAPPIHIDNVSFRAFSLFPYLYILGARNFTDEQSTIFLRRAGALGANETFNSSTSSNNNNNNNNDAMDGGPPVVLGYWIPDNTEESFTNLSFIDPSGGAMLQRRLLITNPFPIMGGNPQVLPFEFREHVARRQKKKIDMGSNSKSPKEYLEKGASGKDEFQFEVPLQHNSQDVAIVQVFDGGLPCGFDDVRNNKNDKSKTSSLNDTDSDNNNNNNDRSNSISGGRVIYVCAEKDEILAWYRNGKCRHEIVLGTPSACPAWTLEKVKEILQHAKEAVKQDK